MKRIKKFFSGSGRKSAQKESNRPSRDKLQKPIQVLTATDISEKLGVDRRKLEKTFITLGWTEKSTRGTIATKEGLTNGATIKYHDMTKNHYVVWDENVVHNDTLKKSLTE